MIQNIYIHSILTIINQEKVIMKKKNREKYIEILIVICLWELELRTTVFSIFQ